MGAVRVVLRMLGVAKQAAPSRIWSTEIALSPLRIGGVTSNSTYAQDTGGRLRESAVRFLRVPPLMQSVRAGVMEWVLEQGQGMRNWGQQHVVHGRARRTVD